MIPARRGVALLAVAAAAGGCTAGGHGTALLDVRNPRLVARADLDPCPASVATHARGSLPAVTLPCLGRGPAVDLAGLRGVPTVVNVWGSWCGPCQTETRYLSAVYDQLKPKVRFLGVDTEESTPDSALDFATHVVPPMRYPSVLDDTKQVLIGLDLPSVVPVTVFVDAAGRIIHITVQPYRSTAQLRADIAHYLDVPA